MAHHPNVERTYRPGARRPAGRRASSLAAAVAVLLALPGLPVAQTTDLLKREVAAIGVTERLGAAVPRDATFVDSAGRTTTLAALGGGRPLLLSFNYTSCPRLCGLQLSGLARALRESAWDGAGYAVVTVSIDPAEKLPQLAVYKQAKVREAGGRAGVAEGWRFLTGRGADVAALAEAVGFRYRFDPKTGEYQHQATLVVVGGDGRVSELPPRHQLPGRLAADGPGPGRQRPGRDGDPAAGPRRLPPQPAWATTRPTTPPSPSRSCAAAASSPSPSSSA